MAENPAPSQQTAPAARGWGYPLNGRKWHYFIGGRSLCGWWIFFGDVDDAGPHDITSGDCTVCGRKLQQLRAKEREEQEASHG